MATVKQMLDDLVAGRRDLDEVAADFRTRSWPAKKRPTLAQVYGVEDSDIDDDPNSWTVVETHPGVRSAQYAVLFAAVEEGKEEDKGDDEGK